MVCPVCGREAAVDDGVFAIHYNSDLLRCEGSNQPSHSEHVEPEKQPAKKAAPRKKPAKKA